MAAAYKINQVALQLYTLRDYCKTLPDLRTTLKRVREIGYEAVQVSGVGVPHAEVKKALDEAGMVCCATHESSDLILSDPTAVSERLSLLGCKNTAYPYPAGVDMSDEKQVRALAEKLEAAGTVLAKHGQVLSYHNHAIEFLRMGAGTVLDFIYGATKPEHLQAELDTYWVQYGGGDPVAWCEKMSGRLPALHLKDYGFTAENIPTYCEVGAGNLDWDRILLAALRSGCKWLIVEQDTCPGDPFTSVRQSFEYLKKKAEALQA
jgi:sugar phosphate isomerase/epimerase